jgi:hypothetical protein
MDLGAFLKTALYRVIFVLIVGIPAVETFSFLFSDNGILIQKVEDNKIPFDGSLKIGKNNSTLELKPVEIQASKVYYLPVEREVSFSNATIVLNNPKIYHLGSFKFTINDLSTTAWVLYLGLAWVLGEILCFLGGDLFIGFIFFNWEALSDQNLLEKITPFSSHYILVSDFSKLRSETILEISEIHFVISRIFAGIFLLCIINIINIIKSNLVAGILSLPIWLIIAGISLIKKKLDIECKIILVIFLVALLILALKYEVYVYTLLGGISLLISIVYRSHANKLIKEN